MYIEEEIRFELISPQQTLLDEHLPFVVVPGSEGELAILPSRAPLVALLKPGVVTLYEMKDKKESVKFRTFISGGMVDVSNDHCRLYTENAIPVKEIDRGAVSNELKSLQGLLKEEQSEARKIELQNHIALNEMILRTLEQDDWLNKRKGVVAS